jgi:hypothetical protein
MAARRIVLWVCPTCDYWNEVGLAACPGDAHGDEPGPELRRLEIPILPIVRSLPGQGGLVRL